MTIRIFIYCLLLFPSLAIAQPAGFLTVQKTGIANYKIESTNYYDGKSLWGYMNGGADLYLEYGFEGLLVQEITFREIPVKCEIYKMKDPLGAFGIFSVQRHNCKQIDGFKTLHCFNNYQIQIVKGDYYISIINQTGISSAQDISKELAEQFDKQIPHKEIPFPDHPFFAGKSNKLIYLKGEISLSNVYPQALSYLDDVSGYTMWLLPSDEKKMPTVSIINFQNTEEFKNYARFAFPEKTFEISASAKLKSGGLRLSRKLNEITVLQAEGKMRRELKKILGYMEIK
jgi:hypothetical protein